MLQTKLGDICITINNQKIKYEGFQLSRKGKNFVVDQRHKILLNIISQRDNNQVIDCILENNTDYQTLGYPETGEELALISFYCNNIKLSIGTIGDIEGIEYEYLKDRIRLIISKNAKISEVTFYIAWVTMEDSKKEDIYTWFAADPTLTTE